jgi:hypothetical protein
VPEQCRGMAAELRPARGMNPWRGPLNEVAPVGRTRYCPRMLIQVVCPVCEHIGLVSAGALAFRQLQCSSCGARHLGSDAEQRPASPRPTSIHGDDDEGLIPGSVA